MKKTILLWAPILLLAVGCAQTKSSDSSTTSTTTHSYGLISGSCYDYTSSAYVTSTYCATTTTTSSYYYLANGYCYSSSTGQVVATSYCSSTTTTATANQCYGTYIYSYYGYMQMVTCAGANCRGYTLIESSTGRSVTCQ